MREILSTLLGYLGKDSLLAILLILPPLIALVASFNKVRKQLEGFRDARIRRISQALASGYLDSLAKIPFEEEVVRRYCADGLGIRGGKKFRKALFAAYSETKQELDFFEYKNASSYLRDDEAGILQVRITRWNKFEHCVLVALGWISAAFGAILLLAFLHPLYFAIGGESTDIVIRLLVTRLVLGFIYLGAGGMLLRSANSFDSALRVEAALRKVRNAKRP